MSDARNDLHNKKKLNIYTITFMAAMAAVTYVVTLFRFPFLGSKVHFANAVCLLSGMLLGPLYGGIAAGLGSALYDLLAGGYGAAEALITFVSKFAMAWVCGTLAHRETSGKHYLRLTLASAAGALTYVALYMLKTFVFKTWVEPVPAETLGAVMVSKLIPSLINALVSVLAAPVFCTTLAPALRSAGLMQKMHGG